MIAEVNLSFDEIHWKIAHWSMSWLSPHCFACSLSEIVYCKSGENRSVYRCPGNEQWIFNALSGPTWTEALERWPISVSTAALGLIHRGEWLESCQRRIVSTLSSVNYRVVSPCLILLLVQTRRINRFSRACGPESWGNLSRDGKTLD